MKAEIKLAKNPDYYYIEVVAENVTEHLAIEGLASKERAGYIPPLDLKVAVLGLGDFYPLKYVDRKFFDVK